MLLYRMETRITILHDTKRSDLDRTEFSIPNGLFFTTTLYLSTSNSERITSYSKSSKLIPYILTLSIQISVPLYTKMVKRVILLRVTSQPW